MNEQHVAGGSIIRGPRPDSSKQMIYCMLLEVQVQVGV